LAFETKMKKGSKIRYF